MDDVKQRVVIVGNTFANMSSDLAQHQGKHGIIQSNDGWGLCTVLLDDGTTVRAWNAADLEVE